jgi:WD40 repeat protein/serine/threonine protein kinase
MPEPSPEAVEALFQQAADLDLAERDALLDALCAGDPDLRAAVEELLHFDARAQSEPDFLHSPAAVVRAALPVSTAPGLPSYIGHYRVLRRHGEGGMGTVYEAEQDSPRRTVALKVIRPGLVSAELLSRFSHEAQILGRLQHPGIAQVYEAGSGEDGQPFFAMEFIRGMPLDEYSRSCGLHPSARLELLAKVCDAVQHAHDKGVIHRDLKPGNILVDPSGQPKVLDFGVAHVTDADLLTTSSRTRTGELLGTLSYMSPEQLAARPSGIDGRSDVYTLGVILFELLAHRLPYHLDQLPVHEVARVIDQQEPSRLGSIDMLYRGDVEIIVAKALEKDKTRRYASAGDLASDIRRYLRGQPIQARPASALYQLRKFARRNKGTVAGVSGIFAALLVGTLVSIAFALRAAASARVADENARLADENARLASERESAATYESYRARIAAAAAAISHRDVVDAARQLEAAPEHLRDWEWRHLHARLDDSTKVFPAIAGESQFLVSDPKGVRIARLTRTSLRLTDLEGTELRARSFPPVADFMYYPPLQTGNSLRLLAKVRKTRTPSKESQFDYPYDVSFLNILDDEGKVHTQLKCPPGVDTTLVAVSPDGLRLAVFWIGARKAVFTVYDAESGKPGATSAQEIGHTWALVFSPDGKRIATGGEDGRTRLWDTSTGALTALCRGHSLKVLSVAFRPDGLRLATTSSDGTVRQWDSTTGREVEPPYDRHTGEVMTAKYSSDGVWIASGGTDRTVRVWRAANRQDLAVLQGHTGDIGDLAFTTDGRGLASVSQFARLDNIEQEDSTVRLWEVGNHGAATILSGHESYVYPVAYSPDGQWIASGSWDCKVRLWDALTGESAAILPHPGNIRALAFSPDSSWLVSGCALDESLHIWNVATARRQNKFKGPGSVVAQAIAVSPDGAHIAAADADGSARIMEAATGALVHSFRTASTGETKSLAYSPDGRQLAGTGEDGTQIDIRATRTWQRSARLTGHTGFVHSVSFSRDGRLLASASLDRTVRVWDVATAKCVALLGGHTDKVYAAAFHPDGKRLASAGRAGFIWLWDLATGKEVARLEGHTNYVFSLAFSPDGRSLVSGSGDVKVRIWDTESPALRHQARRDAEALRPDAQRLVARLFVELHEPAQVVARLRADTSLSDLLRHMAVREVMRRGQQATP